MPAHTPPALVAADDAQLGRLLVGVLGGVGHAVELVADGVEVLRRLRTAARPHVVLLSLRGSRLNSRGVLEAVATDPTLAQGHGYVVLTALWDALPHDYAGLLAGLGVAVIPKPFDLDTLLDVVAQTAGRITAE